MNSCINVQHSPQLLTVYSLINLKMAPTETCGFIALTLIVRHQGIIQPAKILLQQYNGLPLRCPLTDLVSL